MKTNLLGMLLILPCLLFTPSVRAQTNQITNMVSHAAQGDLDGDGYGDVIIQNKDNGFVALMQLVENEVVSIGYIGGSGFSIEPLRLVGTLDVDRDGIEDILWRYGDSDTYIWSTISGTNITGTDILLSEDLFRGWDVVATADFNDDGYGDLLACHQDTKTWAIAYLEDLELINVAIVDGSPDYAAWSVVGAGDVDSDGYPDVLMERTQTGEAGILWMEDEVILDFSPIYGEESATLWPWRIVGLTDIDGTDQVELIMRLGNTGYHEINRTELVGDQWLFDSEPLGGFTSGLGRWRVIGPR